MNELAYAVTVCADFGAAVGGFLGMMTSEEIQQSLSNRPSAETTRGRIASEYADSQAKTDCLAAVDAQIATLPGGGVERAAHMIEGG